MFRRVLSLILIPCVLLTQSAAVGHAHGGGQPAGHDLRPHFHTNPISARHDHPGHHHHQDDGVDEPEPAQTAPPHPESSPDHDDDAVYVAAGVVTTERVQGGDDSFGLPWHSAVEGVAGHRPDPRERSPRHPHPPPDPASSDRPLYLLHLALLI